MNGNGAWIKVVCFVLGAIMLAAVVNVLLDPGLGDPARQQRSRHPAGFSVAVPRGWGATIYSDPAGRGDLIRMSPERVTGQSPAITIAKIPTLAEAPASARSITFQNEPAKLWHIKRRSLYIYTLSFMRNGSPFQIDVSSLVLQDLPDSPYMPFVNSLQMESVITIPSSLPTTAEAGPATFPATAPQGPLLP